MTSLRHALMCSVLGLGLVVYCGIPCHASAAEVTSGGVSGKVLPFFGGASTDDLPGDSVWRNLESYAAPLDVEEVGVLDYHGVQIRRIRYTGSMWKGAPQRVYALYAHPPITASQTKFPAIIQIHGGGLTCSPDNVEFFVKRGYACLAFDWAGARENRKPEVITHWAPELVGEHIGMKHGDKRESTLFVTVLAASRAVDLLSGLPEVDKYRIGVQGVSWGAWITWLFNGLEPRLKAAVPVYGVGWVDEQVSDLKVAMDKDDRKQAYIANYDPVSFAKRQFGPVMFVDGTNDYFAQLGPGEKQLAAMRIPHERTYGINRMHDVDVPSVEAAMWWFDSKLKGAPIAAEPRVELGVTSAGVVSARVTPDMAGEVARVRVDFARGGLHWVGKCWLSAEARTEGGAYVAEVPVVAPSDELCVIGQVFYKNGAMISSAVKQVMPQRDLAGVRGTAQAGDVISRWEQGASGWWVPTSTDFYAPYSVRRWVEGAQIEGRPCVSYRSEPATASFDIATRLMKDTAVTSGGTRKISINVCNLTSLKILANKSARVLGTKEYETSDVLRPVKGWQKVVLKLSDLQPMARGGAAGAAGTAQSPASWDEIYQLNLVGNFAPGTSPGIGEIRYED